jgi:hypothetical protein
MDKLVPPDSFYLSAAVGWIELGNAAEAEAELAQIAPALRTHFAVLEVRWLACAERHDWPAGLAVAREIAAAAPDRPEGWLHRAYATRRVPGGTVEAAWEVLRPAADRFPNHELIPFNLACYACQMGRLEEARQWLKQAFLAGDRKAVRTLALLDEDLRPLWPEVERM